MKTLRLLCLCFFCIFVLCLQGCAPEKLQIAYYYESYCASCHEDREFYELFEQYAPALNHTPYVLTVENTAQTGREDFLERCDRLGVSEAERVLPALFIGDTYISGKDAIAQSLVFSLPSQESDLQADQLPPDPDPDAEVALYFYTSPCIDCSRTSAWLNQFKSDNPALQCESYSILEPNGLALLEACFSQWEVPAEARQVPILFYAGGYLSGVEAIEENLPQLLSTGALQGFHYPELHTEADTAPLSLLSALGAGLLAGLNPCSLSLFFFLIAGLQMQRPFRFYLAYILGRGLMYTAICTAFLCFADIVQTIQLSGWMKGLQILLLLLSLALALLNFCDFFQARAERYGRIHLQLPAKLRSINQRFLSRVQGVQGKWLLPLLVVAGVLMAGGEFFCTGQVTLAGLIVMAEAQIASFAVLLVYIVGLSLPMCALAFLAVCGKQVFELTETARKMMPVIKFANGVFFVVIAVYWGVQLVL